MENFGNNTEVNNESEAHQEAPTTEATKSEVQLKAEIKSSGLKNEILGQPILLWDGTKIDHKQMLETTFPQNNEPYNPNRMPLEHVQNKSDAQIYKNRPEARTIRKRAEIK